MLNELLDLIATSKLSLARKVMNTQPSRAPAGASLVIGRTMGLADLQQEHVASNHHATTISAKKRCC